ncbi:MAG: hypothetical protein ABUK18_11655, partial [Candidatus Bathyarchaeia archaeon]
MLMKVPDLRGYSSESSFFDLSRCLIKITDEDMPPSRKRTSSILKKDDGSPCVKVIKQTIVKTQEKITDLMATGNWFLSVRRHTRKVGTSPPI